MERTPSGFKGQDTLSRDAYPVTHALLEECNCKEALHYASMLLRYGSVAGLGEASLARFVFLAVNIIYKNDIDPRHDMVIREFIISKYQCIKFAY